MPRKKKKARRRRHNRLTLRELCKIAVITPKQRIIMYKYMRITIVNTKKIYGTYRTFYGTFERYTYIRIYIHMYHLILFLEIYPNTILMTINIIPTCSWPNVMSIPWKYRCSINRNAPAIIIAVAPTRNPYAPFIRSRNQSISFILIARTPQKWLSTVITAFYCVYP